MQSKFLQKVGLVFVCAWKMEEGGGKFEIATNLCAS
jgi:hypothetical protein